MEKKDRNVSLDRGTFEYFNKVLNRLDDQFDDDEDKKTYFKNVMKSSKGHEVNLSTHSKLSVALQGLISKLSHKALIQFLDGISTDFHTMATHQAASHVIQSCLNRSFQLLIPSSEEELKKLNDQLAEKVVSFSDWINENFEEVLSNNYACHVLCTLLETLSGRKVSDQIFRSRNSNEKSNKSSTQLQTIEAPAEFKKTLTQLLKKIIKHDDLISIIKTVSSSTVLQTTLLISSKVNAKECKLLVDVLIPLVFNHSQELGHPMTDTTITPLTEKVIDVATAEQLSTIHKKYFKGNIKKLALCRVANFLVQKLIKKCADKEQFQAIYEELTSDGWSEVSTAGHLGVLVAVSDTCARLNACQANFTQRLAELLECWDPKERKLHLVKLLTRWQKFSEHEAGINFIKINYHGSLMLQNMFNFQKPVVACDSLLQMEIKYLIQLFCDPCGSRIIDSFILSKTVGEKRRQSLAEKLKGNLITLSVDKFGSRCVETLWRSSELKLRQEIVEELAENRKQLRNHFGYFVFNLCELDLYKNEPKKWKENQAKTGKRKQAK
ncbi:hypothetical protein CHUAL_003697 [Chamberlinius hualienensis]